MRILVIEDDQQKSEQLIGFLEEHLNNTIIELESSYTNGLRALAIKDYNLLLLDMSLPTFKITVEQSGGKPMSFAGEEILRQLSRRNIKVPTIVITQYDRFERDLSLKELRKSIADKSYSNYIDTIYYNTTNDSWKIELMNLLKEHIGI
ncbi:response regulator [Peribacillus sp. FSL M8-0224]|uniref:response regulator n=1 Tax=Peribacillus sp. FSL M8-0224 TaxID=2921568 RepID=UPI0030F63EB1|nr:hypothetical protein KY492_20305 [Brevibacterium sp. PAMC21349]